MLSHERIWAAIEGLAARYDMSVSGLARKAGLDSTAFNVSKRTSPEGRKRWPSTESIAKILQATGASLEDFLFAGGAGGQVSRKIPLIGFAQAGSGGFFDDGGFPAGSAWDEASFPSVADEHAYALEISGDSMQPVYRDGDVIIVSPAAAIRRGDRVVVRSREGEVLAKELKRQTGKTLELKSLNAEHEDRVFATSDIDWMARIVWSSQ
jgi:phage repressor protein C with HTH and peptisase S24 domain